MADYFPVLSRAVAGLENNTGEARRAIYERARAAIVRQLRAIDPPLSEEDIGRERMQLEEAIRRVEASAAPAAATPSAPAPAAPRPAPRPAPTPAPQRGSQGQTAPEPKAQAERPDRAEATPQQRPERPAGPAAARPAKRPDGRPILPAAGDAAARKEGGRSGPLIALGVLAVIAIGVGLFVARGPIMALFSGGGQTQTAEAPKPAETPSENKPAAGETAADKSDDRLPSDAQTADRPAETPAAPPPEQDVARAPDAAAPPPAEQPAAPQAPAETRAPEAPPPAQSGPLVAQRAVLYEEGPNQQSGEALQGTVLWRTESVPGGSNSQLETAIRGDIEIPGRRVKAALTIRRNADATLPASHTIEIQFTLPEDFPNAGVSNVPGLLMKADESARGAAVSGLSVRVTNGFFLIGLSNLDTERSVNEQLLRDRGWIDLPILYDNGRRAVLTLEKGTPGAQAFSEAFSAWRSASSASNPTR